MGLTPGEGLPVRNRPAEHPSAPSPAGGHPAAWGPELLARVRNGFVRTVFATSLLTGLFFVGYLFVQRHPAYAPVMMPLTFLDLLIPFQAPLLLAYVSIWLYVGVGPGIQRGLRDFLTYGAWLSGLCGVGLAVFYFWPTQVPAPIVAATGILGFDMLHRIDATSNACPSMHVAVAIFTAIRVDETLRSIRSPWPMRMLNGAWFVVIAYSTLAIKQHVVLDVVAGGALGTVFALMSLRWRPHVRLAPAMAPLALAAHPK
jgi:membrane-associated phospholipid phosphatase